MWHTYLFGFYFTLLLISPAAPSSSRVEPILIASNGQLETQALNLIDEYFEKLDLRLQNKDNQDGGRASHAAAAAAAAGASLFSIMSRLHNSTLPHDNANGDVEDSQKEYPGESGGNSMPDIWSLIWYIGAFGGLVGFFMIVSCSECCCTIPPIVQNVSLSSRSATTTTTAQPIRNILEGINGEQVSSESACLSSEPTPPPPPYSLFAPPDYDSLFYVDPPDKKHNRVFIIPIHEPSASSGS